MNVIPSESALPATPEQQPVVTGLAAYQQAHRSAVLIDHSAAFGRFELVDRDRLDLLHRMSTNDTNGLHEGEGLATVLTTALARIIDQLVVYHMGDTALAISGPGMLRPVRLWLQKHIFFNDKIKTRDVSAELAQLGLYGPHAAAIADQIAPGAASLAVHHFQAAATPTGARLLVARTFPVAGDGYWIFVPAAERAAVLGWVQTLQLPEGVGHALQTDATTYQVLRIESGVPEAGHELTEEYIPLEAGLWDAVSFSKGCYIGQEIIARMESRNKLARVLVGLEMRLPNGAALPTTGSAITAEGKTVGTLTSIAQHPIEGDRYIALGYVRTEAVGKPLTSASIDLRVVHNASPGRPT
jgi:aminomethyltransferase